MSASFFVVDHTSSITASYALVNQIEQTLKQHPKSTLTDFFVLQSANRESFDLVYKRSMKGRWMAFKALCAKLCRRTSQLDASQNIGKVHALFQAMRQAEESEFEGVADKEKITVKELHNKINTLGSMLEELKTYIIKKNPDRRIGLGRCSFRHTKKITDVGRRTLSDQEAKQACQAALEEKLALDKSTARQLVAIISESSSDKELLHELADAQLSASEMQSELTTALFDLGTALPKDNPNKAVVEQVLQLLGTREIETHSGSPVELKNVAIVLGDAFIAESDLEGGINAIPYAELAVECMDSLGLNSTASNALKQSLKDAVSLYETHMTAQKLQEQVRKNLEKLPAGHQRCLLYGGWIEHAVVYEIERQPNGLYSFRVYNEGEGIRFHDQAASAYKKRYSGCIGITDIREQDLVNISFLGGLQALAGTRRSTKPEEILVHNLLPLLGGKKEEIDPRYQRYLSPQRSGTCTYRSLQAFFAHALPSEEYKRFKCEYKLFLLEKYRPQLQQNMDAITLKNYQQRRQECTLLTLSLAKFAGGVAKLEPLLSQEKIKEVRKKIVEFEHLVAQYDRSLTTFEQGLYTADVQQISALEHTALPVSRVERYESFDEVEATAAKMQQPSASGIVCSLIQQIEKLDPQQSSFSEDIQAITGQFAKALQEGKISVSDFVYVYDLFCKKVPKLDVYKQIQFSDSSANRRYRENLHTIIRHIVSHTNSQGAMSHRVERYTMGFLTYFALECAYRKLPASQRVFKENFPTFLAHLGLGDNGIRDPLSELHAIDPFWNDMILQLEKETNPKTAHTFTEQATATLGSVWRFFQTTATGVPHKTQEEPFPVPDLHPMNDVADGSRSIYRPSAQLLEEINSWLTAPDQADLRKQIVASVIQDRKDQEVEVRRQIEIQKAKRAECQRNLAIWQPRLDEINKREPPEMSDIRRLDRKIGLCQIGLATRSQLAEYQLERSLLQSRIQPWIREYNQAKKYVEEYKNGIYQADLNIKNMPETVSRMPCYWPKNFEQKSATSIFGGQGPKTDFAFSSVGLTFILGQSPDFFQQKLGIKSVIPESVRDLISVAALTTHMPWCQTYAEAPGTIGLDVHRDETGVVTLRHARHKQFQKPKEKRFCTEYTTDFTSKDFALAYEKLCAMKDLPETEIPAYYATNCTGIQAISEQDMKALLALHRRPIQLDALFLYFSDRVDRLSDHDWFLLFHACCFESHMLLEALQDPDEAKNVHKKCRDFFQTTLAHAMETGQYALAANLLWTASSVQKCIEYTQQIAVEPIIDRSMVATVMQALADPIYADQWPVAFEALAAAVGNFGIDPTDSSYFSHALFIHMFEKLFSNTKERCSLRSEQAENASRDIRSLFSTPPPPSTLDCLKECMPLCKKMLPNIFTDSASWREEEGVIRNHNNTASFSLSTGMIMTGSREQMKTYKDPLPADVASALEQHGIYPSGYDFSKVRTFSQDSVLYIHDAEKGLHLAVYEGAVYTKIGTSYARFIPRHERSYLDHTQLAQEFHHYKVRDTVYLCDSQTHKPVYTIQKGIIQTVKEPKLTLVAPKKRPFLAHFEAESRTLFLADKTNKVQKIDFPRLGLTFFRNSKGSFELEQQKGWCLAKKQFAPLCGPQTGFLVIENAKGETKVLLPVWDAKEPEGKEALSFAYEYDLQAQDVQSAHVVEYDLKEGVLHPRSFEARVFLARIYLEKGAYEKAEQLLFSRAANTNTRVLSMREKQLLEKIAFVSLSKSISGPALRLRLQALYLLRHSAWAFSGGKERKPTEYPERTAGLYAAYLNRLGHIVPLEKDAELFLLNEVILPSISTFAFLYRKAELEGAAPLVPPSTTAAVQKIVPPVQVETRTSDPEPAPRCSEHEKKEYARCREMGLFPFDHTTLERRTEETKFRQYLPLIEAECQSVNDSEACRTSGLLHMLYFVALFGPLDCQDEAKRLLALVESRVSVPPAAHIPTKTYVERKHVEQRVKEQIADLVQLQQRAPVADSADFLANKSKEFFVEKTTTDVPVSASLFAPTSHEITTPAIEKQYAQAERDLAAAQQKMQVKHYQLRPGQDITALRDSIQARLEIEAGALGCSEAHIMAAVQAALVQDPVSALLFASKKRKFPTVQQLCILSAKIDGADLLRKKYPELSPDGVKRLQDALKGYLQQKRFVQHLERSCALVDRYAACTDIEKSLSLEALNRELQVRDGYRMDDEMAMIFLVVETILNIQLRPDQVQNSKMFKQHIDAKQDVVMQMIMGSGKTAILQPVLAFLFAKPDQISTVMVPEALFNSVVLGLSESLGSTFEQNVFTIEYSRQQARDIKYLDIVYQRLCQAKKERACVLLTPRQKHSIVTSLYESFYEYTQAPKDVHDARLRLMAISKICRLLEIEEVAQVDEVDMVMDPTIIFKYPVAHRVPVHEGRAAFVSQLLLNLAFDPELHTRVSIDFIDKLHARLDPSYVRQGVAISPLVYASNVKPKLVQLAIQQLSSASADFAQIAAGDSKKYLQHFLSRTTPYDEAISMQCRAGEEAKISAQLASKTKNYTPLEVLVQQKIAYKRDMLVWIEKNVPDDETRELLGVASKAICSILSESLLKECGSKYDKDPNPHCVLARPYFAPNSPKPTMPSDPYEQILYTVQEKLFNGISVDVVQLLLRRLQNEVEREHVTMGIAVTETKGYKTFQRILKGDAVKHMFTRHPPTQSCVLALQKAMSQDKETLFEFMQQVAFQQVSVFQKSISSTPQTLLGMSHQACGYTGTLHAGILPPKMKAEAELGTDGRTILAIEQKMHEKISSVEMMRPDKSLMDQVIGQFVQDLRYEVFIDSGGWLKEMDTEEFAKSLFAACSGRTPPLEGIIMHDKDDREVCLMQINNKWEKIPRSQWVFKSNEGKTITIIQQKYETGTNIPQRPQAKAFMSIRKTMTLRDTLQSAFRMRGILEGQSVTFGISDEVKEDIALGVFKGLMKHKVFAQAFYPTTDTPGPVVTAGMYEELKKIIPDKTLRIEVWRALTNMNQRRVPQSEVFAACVRELSRVLTIDSQSIWRYLNTNQGYDQEKKNWLSAKQRMREVIAKPVRSALVDPTVLLDEQAALFAEVEALFLHTHTDSPYKEMAYGGKVVDSATAIEHEIAHNLAFIKKIQDSPKLSETTKRLVFEKIRKEYPEIVFESPLDIVRKALANCVAIEDISPVITISDIESGSEQEQDIELEQEQEQEQEVEQEIEQEVEQIVAPPPPPQRIGYQETLPDPLGTAFCGSLFAKKFNTIGSILPKEVLSMFPDTGRMHYSRNFFVREQPIGSADQAAYHLPGQYVLILQDARAKTSRYVLVSHYDAGIIEKGFAKSKEKATGSMTLVSLSGKVRAEFPDGARFDLDKHRSALLQAKLMVGNVKLSKQEMQIIEERMRAIKEPDAQKSAKKELHDFIRGVIQFMPDSREAYRKSRLRAFLTKKSVA